MVLHLYKNKIHLFKININYVYKARFSFQRIADIKDTHQNISLKGWVTSVRKMKENIFFDLNDGTSPKSIQIVTLKNDDLKLQYGCSVEVDGKLVKNKNNQYEIQAKDVKVVGTCELDDGYPFAPRKTYSNDYFRQHLHLRLRQSGFSALSRIRSSAFNAVHDFFNQNHFVNIQTPVLTSNDCEGAGETFIVQHDHDQKEKDFFGNKAFLTVSGQLHLEVAARSLNQVYTLGPTFRAENSKSRLHLSEFYMAEAETTLVQNTYDLVILVQNMFHYVTKHLFDNCSEDIYLCRKSIGEKDLSSDIEYIIDEPICVMTYDEVGKILSGQKLQTKFDMNSSLTKEQELLLVKHNGNKPLFVTEWPVDIKPFYMKTMKNDEKKVMAFDLLCPNVGEVCGGSLREDDYIKLEKKLNDMKMLDKLEWYLELRKYGNVLTGGFGLGFERYLQVLLNILNIKDAILFPRWPHHCKM